MYGNGSGQMGNSYVTKRQSTVIKGLLILLIVLCHNYFFTIATVEFELMTYFYMFHITGFFILPVLYGGKKLSADRLKTYAVRYLWPFFLLAGIFYIGYSCIYLHRGFDIKILFKILIFNDSTILKEYCGFQVLWFLPAMFATLVVRDLYFMGGKLAKLIICLLTIAVVAQFTLNFWGIDIAGGFMHWIPLSFGTALYYLFFAFTARKIIQHADRNKMLFGLCLTASVAISAFYFSPTAMSFLQKFALGRIIFPIAFFYIVWYLSDKLARISLLDKFGENSLLIYLIHPFIGFIFIALLPGYLMYPASVKAIVSVITIVLFPALSYVFARIFSRCTIMYNFLFPNNYLTFKSNFSRRQ